MKLMLPFFALFSIFSFFTCQAEEVLKDSTLKSPLDSPEFSTFKELAVSADVIGLFQGTGPFTVFIPNNAAFEKLGWLKLRELRNPSNKDQLAELLLDHVLPGKYMAKNLKTMTVKTVGGANLVIRAENGSITVNGAKVLKTDLVGPNGVVHEIDTVLLP